jgi:hypothetical protein
MESGFPGLLNLGFDGGRCFWIAAGTLHHVGDLAERYGLQTRGQPGDRLPMGLDFNIFTPFHFIQEFRGFSPKVGN